LIKLVILDLDQTLIDTIHRFHLVFNMMLEEHGAPQVDWPRFIRMYSDDTLDQLIPGDSRSFWVEFRRRYCSVAHPLDRAYYGAGRALEWLRERRLRAAVTTGRECRPADVWRELEQHGLAHLVDSVLTMADCSEEDELTWSRTGLIRLALGHFGVDSSEAVFVGDYWVDMESARRAGVHPVAVRTGFEPEHRLLKHGAKAVLAGIWELPSYLRQVLESST